MYFVCRGEMNTLDLAMKNVVLKKASGTNGGEWQGPCPACGGDDRFHVWPEQNEGKGAYWCRGCGKTGDNIQYLRDFCGLSFRDACATRFRGWVGKANNDSWLRNITQFNTRISGNSFHGRRFPTTYTDQ